jgi:ABC-type transport system substrate-binding protein
MPQVPVVNPGKVTLMIGGWGAGKFDYTFDVGGGNNYARMLHGYLIATNEKTQLLPGIASEWSASQDGRTWTVTVRKGAKFHDGTEITAEDVLWTWRHQWSPEALGWATQSGAQALARISEKIELTGPDKVSITTKFPDAALAINGFSEASPSWWGVLPKRATLHDEALVAAYNRTPNAAGLMKLVRYVPAEVMAFERFDDYYYQPKNGFPEDRRVKFKSLELRLVPEEATRVAAIRAGDADIAPVSLGARKQVEAGGGRLVFGQEGAYFRIQTRGCQKAELPCNKKAVRQALDYAINREIIRDQLFGGPQVMQAKGWAAVTSSTIGYSLELDPPPFDPGKARQLLADAGFPGGKGFGKLTVNTWQSASVPFLPESAQLVADSWKKELGLDVEVKVGEESNIKKQNLTEELYGQVVLADNEARVDAAGINRNAYGTPGHGSRYHETQELFDLTQKAIGVSDAAERPKALNSLYRRLRDETYELSIGYVNIPWAVGPRVVTWQPYPLAFYPSNMYSLTLK